MTHAGGIAYHYDANGNLSSDGRGRSFHYSLRDHVVRIAQGASRSEFRHHHDGQRLIHREWQGATLTATTHYIGSVEVYQASGQGRQFRRLLGGVAIATWYESSQVQELRYLHRDHQAACRA